MRARRNLSCAAKSFSRTILPGKDGPREYSFPARAINGIVSFERALLLGPVF